MKRPFEVVAGQFAVPGLVEIHLKGKFFEIPASLLTYIADLEARESGYANDLKKVLGVNIEQLKDLRWLLATLSTAAELIDVEDEEEHEEVLRRLTEIRKRWFPNG
jgi:hypothetical protein